MTQIEEILRKQIDAANGLLQRTTDIPDVVNRGGRMEYNKEITQQLLNDTDTWEAESVEYLKVLFGEESRQAHDFQKLIRPKYLYRKFKEELISELEHCIAQLNLLIKSDNLKHQISTHTEKGQNSKTPLLFISHSSKDKVFVEALVSLLESLGFDNTNLFCSSIEDYWIGLSNNIFESLRKLFDDHELYVIFIQSPRFFESPVSLNEMGAAWVLKTNFCSILTKDMTKEKMKGVVDASTIYIKVDSDDAHARMNELKKKLTETFNLKPMPESTWERKRNTFLQSVNS